MLQTLYIENFAIIEKILIDFRPGMTVLTGETGAGKSIIIDAVGLIVGGRGSSDYVRYGQKKSRLEGSFHIENPSEKLVSLLDQYEIDWEDEELIIQRDIYQTGRNVCRVNGTILTISMLKEIGSELVDIHGQNEHQALMNSRLHLKLLDRFGGSDLQDNLQLYQEAYKKYQSYWREKNNIRQNEHELLQRIDFLTHQIEEIQAADLQGEEEDLLNDEKNQLVNFQKVSEALMNVYQSLQAESGSALDQLGNVERELSDIRELDPQYDQWAEKITGHYYALQEFSRDLYDYIDQMEYDEDRLNEVIQRLDFLKQLKRKYGRSIEEIISYEVEARTELNQLHNREKVANDLDQQIESASQELIQYGRKLTEIRQDAAKKLENAIHLQFEDLYMKNTRFIVDFQPLDFDAITSDGFEQIRFLISTNPGEPAKALENIASGGELSRIMLAMKTIFTETTGLTSIIFDEIDTGVSGRVAQAIAEKMRKIGEGSQVLSVTHLPQVAAIADHHLYISKEITADDRTRTRAELLSEAERIEEIARMLSGDAITEASLNAAKELLIN